ncbi:MAG TPA: PepSY domain-containing protein [Gemmatimonadaceae bacterium]
MMSHRYALAAVMLAAFALPAAAQQTTAPSDTGKKATTTTSNGAVADTAATKTEVAPSTGAMPAMGAPAAGVTANAPKPEGQVTPHAAAKVDVKVAESLASTVKISGDSAFAIARTSPDAGEISSADLEMKEGRLVYEIKMVNGKNGASEVHVDAMTGELIKDKKYGGLKAIDTHAAESQKLQNAKADSANTPSVKTDSSITKKP